jgi:hypothetical protein
MIIIPTCKICRHPARDEIERRLDHGWAYRVVAAQYGGFSVMSLTRHRPHRATTIEDTVDAGAEGSVVGRAPYATTGDLIKDLDVLRASIAWQLTHLALRYLGRQGLTKVVRQVGLEATEQAARRVLAREAEAEARGQLR